MAALVATPTRRYTSEMTSLLDKIVTVRTTSGKRYTGKLLGFEMNRGDVVLGDATDEKGETYVRVFIYSHVISEIYTKTPPLNLEELARRLERYFPKMVKYIPEARTIVIMERIKVTDEGVQGTGPMAEKVRRIFEEFLEEYKSSTSK